MKIKKKEIKMKPLWDISHTKDLTTFNIDRTANDLTFRIM